MLKNLFFYITLVFSLFINYSKAQKIASGRSVSYFLCANGTVMSSGGNSFGQLGNNSTVNSTQAVAVLGLNNIVSISSRFSYALALKSDGTVWAWGSNNYGMLGDSSTINRTIPVQVRNLTHVVSIAAGLDFALALKDDGTVWSWGNNLHGQLGISGAIGMELVPKLIVGLNNINSISAGDAHCLALKSDGYIWSWGYNLHGQLGDSTTQDKFYPVKMRKLKNVIRISCGGFTSLALKADSTIWGCGLNIDGQLGDGTNSSKKVPVKVLGINNVIEISGGELQSYALKSNGTVWAWGSNIHGQLGDGTTISRNVPVQTLGLNNVRAISGGVNHVLALKIDGTVWGWGENYLGELSDSTTIQRILPIRAQNLCYITPPDNSFEHNLNGRCYFDSDTNCFPNISEQSLPFIPMLMNPGNYTGSTNDSGYYSFGLNDSIQYTITPIIPSYLSHLIYSSCPINFNVNLNSLSTADTSGFDFGLRGSLCYQLRTDIYGNRKRRCVRNQTSVYFVNDGFLAADSVELHVKFAKYDLPIMASIPYTWNPIDSSIVFQIGTLNSKQSGTISITDSIACVSGITGLTQCTKAWILPQNKCLIDSTTGSNWDHSSIVVYVACLNDSVLFTIKNIGIGNMVNSNQYSIYADSLKIQNGNFQLNTGDSLQVRMISNGATLRLEANQNPGHPGNSHPNASIEACGIDSSGSYTKGLINQFPQDDADVAVEIDCMVILDSYDPNEKTVAPEGVNVTHTIPIYTPLDYTINFQNTGNDTAYKIVIIDTLSALLDISTLEPGVASHSYSISLTGQNQAILKFIFNNINLTDSTTNEQASHGFVKFKISPFNNIPLGEQIENAADIYFDYNFPVHTNKTYVTIGNYTSVIGIQDIGQDITNNIVVYPNPTSGNLRIHSTSSPISEVSVFNLLGLKILTKLATNNQQFNVNLDVSDLSSGIYFIECIAVEGSTKIKFIKE